MSDTRIHRIWKNMLTRCSNPKVECFKNYGGRGISVCERWRVFENFFADMGQPPSPKHSIDRIDVNGDYRPGNCRWATSKEQAQNKTTSRSVKAFGKAMTATEWSSRTSISSARIRARIARGWSEEEALTIPMGSFRKPRVGLQGSKSPLSKITEAQVLQARKERSEGVHYLETIKNLGITRGQYWSAILCWKHL
ncbi:MAG TPA: hypothetical protein VM577_09705 [Anaerovoracaceae bacterium]|nr:hypothetical protein [Anaerovoracaceae bacterium]